MPIAKKRSLEEESRTLKFFSDIRKFYKRAKRLASDLDGLILQAPKLYTSSQGRLIRRASQTVYREITEAYTFRKKPDVVSHYLSRAYNSSVKTVERIWQEKALERLQQRDIFKNVIRKYSEYQKELFDFIKSIDEGLVDDKGQGTENTGQTSDVWHLDRSEAT